MYKLLKRVVYWHPLTAVHLNLRDGFRLFVDPLVCLPEALSPSGIATLVHYLVDLSGAMLEVPNFCECSAVAFLLAGRMSEALAF